MKHKVLLQNVSVATVFSTVLLSAFEANADTSVTIGKIVKLNDAVVRSSTTKSTTGPLRWGDEIETKGRGLASIVLFPAVALNLTANTKVKFVGSVIQKAGQSVLAEGAVQLLRGVLLGRLQKFPGQQLLRVLAPRSSSSIRGTIFSVSAGENDSLVYVEEGIVEVTDLSSGNANDVKAGTAVSADKSTSELQSLSEKQTADIKRSVKKIPPLLQQETVDALWQENQTKVVAEQMAFIKELQKELKDSVESTIREMKQEIEGMRSKTKQDVEEYRDWLKK
jgi:hypothetical protein